MMYSRIRRAAVQRVTSDGIFTPVDLLAALKGSDTSVGKGAFAKGKSPMQDLAGAGSRRIRQQLGDSGTPERHIWMKALGMGIDAGVGSGAAYGATHGIIAPETLAAMTLPGLAYTGPAMAGVQT